MIHITPLSQNGSCLEFETCITLTQFASYSTTFLEMNTTLILLPGNHSLDSSISLGNLEEFQLQSTDNYHTEITCAESAHLSLYQMNRVIISGVKLDGCGGSRFDSINEVFLENLTFTSMYTANGAALELVSIGSAHISKSQFVSNSLGSHRSQTEILEYLRNEYTAYSNIETSAKVGGALILSQSNVNISECLFEANNAQVGGAIYSEHSSNLTLRKCNFTQNYVHCIDSLCLGGVMVINSGCTLNVHDSNFWNNTDAGVIVLLSATAHVSESEFSDNKGKSGGVFSLFESALSLEHCIFHKNIAVRFGGVIFAGKAGKLNITENVFHHNEAKYGGVVFGNKQSLANIESSTFANNKAEIFGGVSYMLEGVINICNSTFNNNTAKYGAALNKHYCNITVHNSTFFNNTAYTNGGALYIPEDEVGPSNVLVNSNYFISNRAGSVGGALVLYNSNTVIHNNTFSFNSAGDNGAVIYGRKWSVISINKSTFTQNSAQIGILNTFQCLIRVNESSFKSNNASSAGGIATISESSIEFFKSTFLNNFGSQGGIVYTINSTALIDNCTCDRNWAMTTGGVVQANENSSIIIKRSLFAWNSAGVQGGVAIISSSSVLMEDSTIKNSIATTFGAAIIADRALEIVVNNCTFINNSAELGGAFYNYESDMTVNDSLFQNNSALRASSLYVAANSSVFVTSSIFSDNAADEQGGVSLVINSTLTIHNSSLGRNTAIFGGVISLHGRGTFFVYESEFLDNWAENGGIAFANTSKVSVTNCTINSSRALTQGGVVNAILNSSVVFVGSVFSSNHANTAGGVVYATLLVIVNMDKCTFFNNSAEIGGTIYNFKGNLTSRRCIFVNNFARSDGAVLYSYGFIVGNFTSNTFQSNRAGQYGGAIYLYTKNTISVESSTFDNNTASHAGGAVFVEQSTTLFINSSNFTTNTVGLDPFFHTNTDFKGGIIYVTSGSVKLLNSKFLDNRANVGGVLCAERGSMILLSNCTCSYNYVLEKGGVIHISDNESEILAVGSIFNNNQADQVGGVISAVGGVTIYIEHCTVRNNTAENGGVLYGLSNNITISHSSFYDNTAHTGVLNLFQSTLRITESSFVHNTATYTGGTVIIERGTLSALKSAFSDNLAAQGGVIYSVNTSVSLILSSFRGNKAEINGGVLYVFFQSSLVSHYCNFSSNTAGNDGGVVFSLVENRLEINNGHFNSNVAANDGAVFFISFQTNLTLSTLNKSTDTYAFFNACSLYQCQLGMTLENNIAVRGGVIFTNDFSYVDINGDSRVNVQKNRAQLGIFYMYESTLNSSAVLQFEDNVEAIHVEKSIVIFTGKTHFIHCSSSPELGASLDRKGGAVKAIQSELAFDGQTLFQENKAENGAAMHAIESNVSMKGETVVTNNTAEVNGGGMCFINSKVSIRGLSKFTVNQALEGGAIYSKESIIEIFDTSEFSNNSAHNGGGFYLQSSELNVNDNVIIAANQALENGGGILAKNTTIVGESTIQIIENQATRGGGCAFDERTNIYQNVDRNTSQSVFIFTENSAEYGGALFIDDENNVITCANIPYKQNTSADCFFVTSTPHKNVSSVHNFKFSQNIARFSGDDLFGGLLDRCTTNTEDDHNLYEGLSLFKAVSRKTGSKRHISSHPVRVCFCSNGQPNCNYQHPIIEVKSGERFSLQLAALDQAKHVVNATIHVSLQTIAGGLGESQTTQQTYETCTELNYTLYSPLEYEVLNLYPDGPCRNIGISRQTLELKIKPCTCPIGFQITTGTTDECVCGCDSILAAYISECDHSTQSVTRRGNYWLTYINTTISSGYLVYPNCPLDYCHLPTDSVNINLNAPAGSDAQCTSNKAGILCGGCREGLSLSLGSSRCITCPKYWPGVMIMLLIFGFLAGIGLVAAVLVLNLTVAVGTINGLIFYANIVEAFKTTFFPLSEISFASIIVSWINMEPGFDVCLFEGMDKYTKTWLQLVFPAYVIVLVGVIIFTTQHSTRFSELIGKKNPVATLATLILLSYAKLLQIVITALSFANLQYPDGSHKTVWLPDATVQYFEGKHSALVLVSIVILLVGVFFTTLLFAWQWLLRLAEKRYFRWITHQKLHLFIESYNAPYNLDHRYWVGLLLLVRVILYFISAINVSGDPRVTFLTLLFMLGGLLAAKWMYKGSIYKTWHNNIFEGVTHINLLILTAFSWYTFETGKNQSIVVHISVAITLILLILVIVHHLRMETSIFNIFLKLKKCHSSDSSENKDVDDDEDNSFSTEIMPNIKRHERIRRQSTFSVVEVPKPHSSSMETITEKEGLAEIEFHDLDNTGTSFINPFFTLTTITEGEADSEQADCILELGARYED